LAAALAVLTASGAAVAQVREDGPRLYQEQLRVELDKQQAAARELGLDAGGWLSFGLFRYDDNTRQTRTLRLWASYSLQGVHQFYIRGMAGYNDWNAGDNARANEGDKYEDVDIERAWYRFDYNRMIRNRTGRDPEVGFTAEVGRNFHQIGSGLVLALPLDAVRITGHFRDWQLTGLAGMTVPDTANIDNSAAVDDEMDRCFYGVELRYTGFDRHEPYLYYLWQTDHTHERPNDAVQDYNYDSSYLGIGSGGSLISPNLRYLAELVFETGRGFPQGTNRQREDVQAMALDVLLEYFFQCRTHPKISFEYLWGSGDPDRRLSSTSTIGGNLIDTRDEAFNAFGFRDTGLALAPEVSNLHIIELGLSAFPLENLELFKKMEVGTKVYFYAKDKSKGAISEPTGNQRSSWVGWEWDLFCNWRISSDVSLTVRYGAFQPGSAFADRGCRQFLYTGLTYSF